MSIHEMELCSSQSFRTAKDQVSNALRDVFYWSQEGHGIPPIVTSVIAAPGKDILAFIFNPCTGRTVPYRLDSTTGQLCPMSDYAGGDDV